MIGYLQHADVLVVPHVVTAFTDSLDPIKLYEYQAVGRPVVSTSVAGFRDADDPRITLADGDAFPAAVAAALPDRDSVPGGRRRRRRRLERARDEHGRGARATSVMGDQSIAVRATFSLQGRGR